MEEWEAEQPLRHRQAATSRRPSNPETGNPHALFATRSQDDQDRGRVPGRPNGSGAPLSAEQDNSFPARYDMGPDGRYGPQPAARTARRGNPPGMEASGESGLREMLHRMMRSVLECCFVASSIGLVFLLFLLHMQFMGTSSCLPVSRIVAEKPDIVEIRVVGVWWRLAERMKQEMLEQTGSEEERMVAEAIMRGENPEVGRVRGAEREAARAKEEEEQAAREGAGGGGLVEEDGLEAAIAVTAEQCAVLLRQLAQDDTLLLLMAMEELDSLVQVPLFLFSREKGLLILSPRSLLSHNVSRMNLTLSSSDECFGGGLLSWALEHVIGYDTVVLNQLAHLSAATGRAMAEGGRRLPTAVEGWVHLVHASDLYNLSVALGERTWRDVVLSKGRVLVTCVFLVLATTALVAFTLRETHVRILRFTLQLRYHHRNGVPYLPLLASHLLESLAFVPIMIGVLMFLFEFFDDQMLAFMVFSVVWVSEIFCIVRVRGNADMLRFPQLFLALFTLFLVYVYSFPLGFSYVAFTAWVAAVAATMLYFSNHFNHPADRNSSNSTLGIHIATATFFWT